MKRKKQKKAISKDQELLCYACLGVGIILASLSCYDDFWHVLREVVRNAALK